MQSELIGTTIDNRFLVHELLGAGAFATVYKARQAELSRTVALKILHGTAQSTGDAGARFVREAQLLAGMHHENIVRVYGFGTTEQGHPYLSMEYLQGKTLAELLVESGHLGWQRTVAIGTQICNALAFAHQEGIVHRDISPRNIMILENDVVKVLDFGLSTMLPHSERSLQKLTQTGTVLGTVTYMSPEATVGTKANECSDIYSLGCVLYECLSGQRAFDGADVLEVMQKHNLHMPQPLSSLPACSDIPRELELIVFKALQKRPEDRFQTATEFGDALTLVQQGRGAEIDFTSVRIKAKPQAKKFPHLTLAIGGALVAFAIVGTVVAMQPWKTDAPARPIAAQTAVSPAQQNRLDDCQRARDLIAEAKESKAKGDYRTMEAHGRMALLAISHKYDEDIVNADFQLTDLEILSALADLYDRGRIGRKFAFSPFPQTHNVLEEFQERDISQLSPASYIKLMRALGALAANYGFHTEAATYFYTAIEGKGASGPIEPQLMDEMMESIPPEKRDQGLIAFYVNLGQARVAASHGKRNEAIAAADRAWNGIQQARDIEPDAYFSHIIRLFSFEQGLGDREGMVRAFNQAETSALTPVYGHWLPGAQSQSATAKSIELLQWLGNGTADPVLKARITKDIQRLNSPRHGK